MATVKQTRSLDTNRLAAYLAKGYGALMTGIGKLFGDTTGDIVLIRDTTATNAVRADHLFAQALYEDSNLEMDWLWYAANMASDPQRRYCLERALRINPDSDLAQRALAQIPKART